MNSADKKRLLYLCSICPKESLIIFDDNEAYANSQSHTSLVKLSGVTFQSKVGISPLTLQSIITMMPDGDIDVRHMDGLKFKFKSKGMQRILTAVDAEYSIRLFLDKITDPISIVNPEEFAKAIAFTTNFAHKDTASPFSSVHISIRDNYAVFFATDGTSMAYKKYVQKMPFEDEIDLLLPQQHIPSAIRTLTDDDAKIAYLKIDQSSRRMELSTKNFSSVFAGSTDKFKDFLSLMDNEAAISSKREIKSDAKKIEVDNTELKQALNNIISMFVKNECPYVDVHIYKDRINLETETTTRGYDCFRASIPAKSNGEYSIRVSPTMFLKALSKVKSASIYWRENNNLKVNPFVVDNGSDMVFFAPTKMHPKDDENYD